MWKNSRTGTIYSEQGASNSAGLTDVRIARTQRWSTVLTEHLEEYVPDAGLAFLDELEPPVDALEPVSTTKQLAAIDALAALPAPRLPEVHAALRGQSYNVGSVMAMLSEIEPHWPTSSILNTLNVAVLLLQDEADRVKAAHRA